VKAASSTRELFFKPYDANQLREIMFNREDAFQDGGVLSEDVIPLSAAFAAQEHGDARKAIDILRHAGEVAYEAGAEQVTEERPSARHSSTRKGPVQRTREWRTHAGEGGVAGAHRTERQLQRRCLPDEPRVRPV